MGANAYMTSTGTEEEQGEFKPNCIIKMYLNYTQRLLLSSCKQLSVITSTLSPRWIRPTYSGKIRFNAHGGKTRGRGLPIERGDEGPQQDKFRTGGALLRGG